MKPLLLSLLLLALAAVPAFAQDDAADQTMVTLENSQNVVLTNETVPPEEKVKNTVVEKPRSKWDFSDRPQDKKNKTQETATKSKSKSYSTKQGVKPRKDWMMTNDGREWKTPSSNKKSSSNYSGSKY